MMTGLIATRMESGMSVELQRYSADVEYKQVSVSGGGIAHTMLYLCPILNLSSKPSI